MNHVYIWDGAGLVIGWWPFRLHLATFYLREQFDTECSIGICLFHRSSNSIGLLMGPRNDISNVFGGGWTIIQDW